jgi:hypothetical protein
MNRRGFLRNAAGILVPTMMPPAAHAGLVTQSGPRRFASSGGGSFTPLQHLSMDGYTTGQPVTALDQFHSSLGNGYGSSVVTDVHRPGKSKSLRLSIQAGTTGSPGDGTPAGHGLFGGIIYPPASQGANYFGGQGSWYHLGMWMYVPSSFSPISNIQDGAVKFLLHTCPITGGTSGKDDVHICVDGYAFLNEFDPNNGTNNSYPSQRAGTEQGFPTDQWFFQERGDFLHSNGDLAITRVWTNGVLWLERNGRDLTHRTTDGNYHTTTRGTVGCPTLPISAAKIESTYLFTYLNGGAVADMHLYIDDVITAVSQTGMTTDSRGNFMMGSAAV